MGYILIKDIQIANIDKLVYHNYYKIIYKLPTYTLTGLTFRLHNIKITLKNNYYIIELQTPENIKLVKDIDDNLSIPYYIPLLDNNSLKIKNSPKTQLLIHKYTDSIDLHIIGIKKYAYQYHPIVYIL